MNAAHTPTPGPWRVQADPLLPKRHPYHDSRYITTDHDLETWRSPTAEGHGDDMCGFAKDDGSAAIIAVMRDGEHQKANAQLIASAPELLAQRDALKVALNCIMDAVDWQAGNCNQTAMVGAVLEHHLITQAHAALALVKEGK